MVVGLFVYQHLFSSRETKFLINLLRTHPRFRSATWPLLLPQVLRYPLGRDYSVTPPLSVERGNSWVAAAPPAVKRARINVQKFAGVFNSVNSNWMFLRKPAEWTFRASYIWLSDSVDSHGLSFWVCRYCPTSTNYLAANSRTNFQRT